MAAAASIDGSDAAPSTNDGVPSTPQACRHRRELTGSCGSPHPQPKTPEGPVASADDIRVTGRGSENPEDTNDCRGNAI